MTISEGTFGSLDDRFDAGLSGTYASIRTYSNYAEAWRLWSDKDSTPSEAQARLPTFSMLRPFSRCDFESVRQHLLRGCMTLKLMHSISVDENPDLAITSALWLPVQAYYAVHGFGVYGFSGCQEWCQQPAADTWRIYANGGTVVGE